MPDERVRVAACLLLLYAQPVSRIVRLTIDNVLHDGQEVLIRLGEPPSPVPDPVGEPLLELVDNRENMHIITDTGSTWLFPGQRAGQPLHPEKRRGFALFVTRPGRMGSGPSARGTNATLSPDLSSSD